MPLRVYHITGPYVDYDCEPETNARTVLTSPMFEVPMLLFAPGEEAPLAPSRVVSALDHAFALPLPTDEITFMCGGGTNTHADTGCQYSSVEGFPDPVRAANVRIAHIAHDLTPILDWLGQAAYLRELTLFRIAFTKNIRDVVDSLSMLSVLRIEKNEDGPEEYLTLSQTTETLRVSSLECTRLTCTRPREYVDDVVAHILSGFLPRCNALRTLEIVHTRPTYCTDSLLQFTTETRTIEPADIVHLTQAEHTLLLSFVGCCVEWNKVSAVALPGERMTCERQRHSGNCLPDTVVRMDGLHLVCPYATICTNMTGIDLAGLEIGLLGARLLAEFLPQCQSLVNLDLSDNKLQGTRLTAVESQGIRRLLTSIGGLPRLQHLNLAQNRLQMSTLTDIAGMLRTCRSLVSFDYSGCYIGWAGALDFASALSRLSTLDEFRFSSLLGGLSSPPARCVLSHAMTHLNIRGLCIQCPGVLVVLAFLSRCVGLQTVNISDTTLGGAMRKTSSKELEQVAVYLSRLPRTVREVDMRHNMLTPVQLVDLKKAITEKGKLHSGTVHVFDDATQFDC